VGWGLGIERVLDLLKQEGIEPVTRAWDAYVVIPDAAAQPQAPATAEVLRAAGLSVLLHAAGKDGPGSMKSQFKKADASGAHHALIFGADERARGEVSIKPLRDVAAAQRTRALADAAAWAHELRNA
jgi:histidyl-tRNA synthetase